MSRKWLVVCGVVVVVGLVCFCLYLFAISRPGITKANYDRIRDGDTQAQVEKLLGGPPAAEALLRTFVGPGERQEVWEGDAGAVVIAFDAAGQVVVARWEDHRLPFLDRLLRRLHLR